MPRDRSTERAVAETASVQEARAAAGAAPTIPAGASPETPLGGPGTADPLVADLRRAGLLPLLVLHFLAAGPSYGHQLMERVRDLTGGLVQINPNTMYPLLRALEGRELIAGEWEHPERRSRRFYRLTGDGEAERRRLLGRLAPHLDRVAASVDEIRRELLGGPPGAGGSE